MSQALSTQEISGPDTVCSGQEAAFDINASGVLWNFALPNTTTDDSKMTPGNRQRKNMMMWQRLRQAQKSMKNGCSDNHVTLNTTMVRISQKTASIQTAGTARACGTAEADCAFLLRRRLLLPHLIFSFFPVLFLRSSPFSWDQLIVSLIGAVE